jgi:hypothetical protein
VELIGSQGSIPITPLILKINIMKFKEGNYYKCIRWQGKMFTIGEEYFCKKDNCLIINSGECDNMCSFESDFKLVKQKHTKDSIVESVINDLDRRSKLGIKKYGTTLDRTDLSRKEWLQHAYEESLDKSLYLKKLISLEDEI